MATAKRPRFEIVAKLDTSEVFKALKEMSAKFRGSSTEINQSLEVIGKGVGAVKTVVDTAFRAMVTVLGLATTAFLSTAEAATDFQRALAEVQTISDRAVFSTGRITEETGRLATLYGGEVQLQARALYQTISSGVTGAAEATELLDVANRAAIGGLTDVETAVDGLTTLTNAYRESNFEAEQIADKLFVTVQKGKTRFNELTASIGQVAPIAATTGISLNELLAATATITKSGLSTAEAFTQVRSILVAVAKQSQRSRKVAAKLGVDFSIAALRAKGLKRFLTEITIEAGASETEIARLFGRVEGLSGAMTLTAGSAAEFASVLRAVEDSADSNQRAFERMSETLGFQLDRFESIRDAGAVALGDLTAGSGEAVQGLADLNDTLADIVELLRSPETAEAVNLFFQKLRLGVATTIEAYLAVERFFASRFGRVLSLSLGATLDIVTLDVDDAVEKWGEIFETVLPEGGVEVDVDASRADETLENFARRLRTNVKEAMRQGLGEGIEDGLDPLKEIESSVKTSPFQKFLKQQRRRRAPKRGARRGRELTLETGLSDRARQVLEENESITASFEGLAEARNRLEEMRIERDRELLEIERADVERHESQIFDIRAEFRRRGTEAILDFGASEVEVVLDMLGTVERSQRLIFGKMITAGVEAARIVTDSTGQMISATVEALATGGNAAEAAGKLFGGMIKQLGHMLIQMGSAALVTSALSLIPIFQPFVGAPGMSAAAGAAALAGGVALVAAGAAIEAGATPSAPATISSSIVGGGLRPAETPDVFGAVDRRVERSLRAPRRAVRDDGSGVARGFVDGPREEKIVNNYVFQMSGIIAGSEAEGGRAMLRMIRAADRLSGAAARGAG